MQWDGRLAVIGAGVMGTGITTLAVSHGIPVTLIDVDAGAAQRAAAAVATQRRAAQLFGKLPRDVEPASLHVGTSLGDAADADVIIEAIVEVAEAKAALLSELSTVARPTALIVSNTSAIPIDELANSVKNAERVVGAHFMNPPYMIRTIEVIRGPRTGDEALGRLTELLEALGGEVLVVNDGPGFVINRVLQRMINESARIVADGTATAETVDRLFQGCLGHSTGPLATGDLIGLDNVVDSLRVLHERTGDAGYEPCDLLVEMVARGDFGRKTGRGFYTY